MIKKRVGTAFTLCSHCLRWLSVVADKYILTRKHRLTKKAALPKELPVCTRAPPLLRSPLFTVLRAGWRPYGALLAVAGTATSFSRFCRFDHCKKKGGERHNRVRKEHRPRREAWHEGLRSRFLCPSETLRSRGERVIVRANLDALWMKTDTFPSKITETTAAVVCRCPSTHCCVV